MASDVGKPAHDYTILTLDGRKLPSADLKGQVVVLNYWASWCGPCKAEMLVFDNYIRAHPGTDLKVYAVETDGPLPKKIIDHLQSAASFTFVRKVWSSAYGEMFAVPTSYVIDRNGILRHAKAGAFSTQSFDALVTPLLAQPPPTPPTTIAAK